MRRDFDVAPVVFVVAIIMLGVAAGVVVLRHQQSGTSTSAPTHHRLDSPYQAMLFHKGQLHAPSNRSVGHIDPRNVARAYERAGYEWVAITDQNTLTTTDQVRTPGIVPIAGTEAFFPFARILEYGVDIIPPADNLQKALDDVHMAAGVAILAHPREAPVITADQVMAVHGVDAIEILDAGLQKNDPVVADATDMWDQLLTRGKRVWGVVGDDSIDVELPTSSFGKTSVDVQVPDVQPALVGDAISRGAFVDSTGVRVLSVDTPATDTIRVITSDATTIKWYGKGGALLATTSGAAGSYKVRWDEKYVRAVASRPDGAQAWTQPVFVVP